MDQQHKKVVVSAAQMISDVPLLLGDDVQPFLGSPLPYTLLLGGVSITSDPFCTGRVRAQVMNRQRNDVCTRLSRSSLILN